MRTLIRGEGGSDLTAGFIYSGFSGRAHETLINRDAKPVFFTAAGLQRGEVRLNCGAMEQDIDRVLIGQERIAERVGELAAQITRDHLASAEGHELVLVPILTGAMIFCCDLMRQIPIALRLGLFTVSSYPGTSLASQGARIVATQIGDIRDRNVVLLDDILDSGQTLERVVPELRALRPKRLWTCVLLRKDRPSARKMNVDYVGFDIPDQFVVGYGLDFNNYYRNLPDIVTLKPRITAGTT